MNLFKGLVKIQIVRLNFDFIEKYLEIFVIHQKSLTQVAT